MNRRRLKNKTTLVTGAAEGIGAAIVKGIRCNVVCPGWVRTPMSDKGSDRLALSLNTDREGTYTRIARDLPLGKAAKPEEIAPLWAYLVSDESSFTMGSVLVIDGGSAVVDAGAISLKV